MLPPDLIYYVYCLVCSTFIAKHLYSTLTYTLNLEEFAATTKARHNDSVV